MICSKLKLVQKELQNVASVVLAVLSTPVDHTWTNNLLLAATVSKNNCSKIFLNGKWFCLLNFITFVYVYEFIIKCAQSLGYAAQWLTEW